MSNNNLILKINTCALEAGSALSSGVVPARNHVIIQIPFAGSYLLRQGLLYPGLYFIGMGSPAKGPIAI
ncbi:MAG: hypothetical protein B7X86_02210 [Sphingobacteriales bacterium 17-39-43]|nr:MAG: hypothetical protein B7Y24_02210 [Sphingobacteriales bacterium 16-39-50]OZA26566.1 MAG: hypothetical protein B7X86_02210 [Sphingobacteriales bacterium 17-39-43]